MSTSYALDELRHAMSGTVLTAADDGWDGARAPWNLAFDRAPALLALPATTTADVVAIVEVARRHGLKVAPQTTGHNAGALGPLDDAILVCTERLDGVTIDVSARTASVGAGTRWGAVTAATDDAGLYPLSGSSPGVGVVGYLLGGGLGWLARKHGLAANHVTSIEVVTPDGALRQATPSDEPDLFWALRGGGANFGVVTSMSFRLFAHSQVTAGMFLWPYDRHLEVLESWHRWTRGAPDEVTTSFRIMHFPPLEQLPPFLSGRSVVIVDGVVIGDGSFADSTLTDLRALSPEMDTWAASTPAGLGLVHMDPPDPTPAVSATALLRDLDEVGLERFAAAIPPGSPLLFGELRHLGGALAAAPDGGGATSVLAGEFCFYATGMGTAAGNPAIEPALQAFLMAMAPYDTGQAFANFTERPTDASVIFRDADLERLRRLRAHVDPDRLMLAAHPVPGPPSRALTEPDGQG